MVVDDEQVVREVICNALEGPNIFLVETSNGEEAISLLLREAFDLVIADKNLPGITGMDVIRRARAIDPNMGALLITAYASRDSAEEAMAIGVDNYIEKPFGITDLEEKVKDALARREVRQRINEPKTGRSGSVKRRRVTICEPNQEDLDLLIAGIKLLGHQPRSVRQVIEVIETLRTKQADTLICNLELLHLDNARSCFLRSIIQVHPQIRFVAVSQQRNVDNIVQAIHHGARKILYTPLESGMTVARELEGFLGRSILTEPSE